MAGLFYTKFQSSGHDLALEITLLYMLFSVSTVAIFIFGAKDLLVFSKLRVCGTSNVNFVLGITLII